MFPGKVPRKLHGGHARRRRIYEQCVSHRLERSDHENFCRRPEYYITSRDERRPEKRPTEGVTLLWAPALHQTAQGWEVEESLRCTKFTKVEKQVESEMFRYLEMALIQTCESWERGETKMIWCLDVVLYSSRENRKRRE